MNSRHGGELHSHGTIPLYRSLDGFCEGENLIYKWRKSWGYPLWLRKQNHIFLDRFYGKPPNIPWEIRDDENRWKWDLMECVDVLFLASAFSWRANSTVLRISWDMIPIGSVCMPYMVTFTINISQMLAYIPYMEHLGYIWWLFLNVISWWFGVKDGWLGNPPGHLNRGWNQAMFGAPQRVPCNLVLGV